MLAAYLAPLAPAAVLLLGAFILPLAMAGLARRWPPTTSLRYLIASGVVELAILALLGIQLLPPGQGPGGLEPLSDWTFSTPEMAAALAVQVTNAGLPFLILALIVLLAATLAAPSFIISPQPPIGSRVMGWLGMGAGACFLFVAANELTLAYAIVAFDAFTAFYWLRQEQYSLVVGRVLLGLITAGALLLAALASSPEAGPGPWLPGMALWLRLGLYPWLESRVYARRPDYGFLIYLNLSLAAAIYLAGRILTGVLPAWLAWLTVGAMTLHGLQAWLADRENLVRPVISLVAAEALSALLVVPVVPALAPVYAVGLGLSLVVLGVTPRLGPPRFDQVSGWWPYLPVLAASLTLAGVPFSLGWSIRTELYGFLLEEAGLPFMGLVALAEGLAFSGLIHYWQSLQPGNETDSRRSGVGVLAMFPFLIPGLAPMVLAMVAHADLGATALAQPEPVWLLVVATLIGAGLLGYSRHRLVESSGMMPAGAGQPDWLWSSAARLYSRLGKTILRVQVTLEGQHYMGWALFAGLIGGLVILLSYY